MSGSDSTAWSSSETADESWERVRNGLVGPMRTGRGSHGIGKPAAVTGMGRFHVMV